MQKKQSAFLVYAGILLSFAMQLQACSVPVFRYALERWVPDNYRATIRCNGAVPETLQNLINDWENTGFNIRIQTDKTPPTDAAAGKCELRVDFPPTCRTTKPLWVGPLTSNTINAVANSPVRSQIADRILGGDSVVWLLLESGNTTNDAAAKTVLLDELKNCSNSLKLPQIDDTDISIVSSTKQTPLKIAFSLLTLSRNNQQEAVLINALLNNSDSQMLKQPAAYPICGAGRAFPPLVGSQITPDNINMVCTFLTGECSCEIKNMNPGFDLPMNIDWSRIGETCSYTETSLPPLSGVMPAAAGITNSVPAATSENSASNQPPAAAQEKPSSLPLAILSLGICAFLLLALGSAFIIRRTTHQ
jgi:hypothetical protein